MYSQDIVLFGTEQSQHEVGLLVGFECTGDDHVVAGRQVVLGRHVAGGHEAGTLGHRLVTAEVGPVQRACSLVVHLQGDDISCYITAGWSHTQPNSKDKLGVGRS